MELTSDSGNILSWKGTPIPYHDGVGGAARQSKCLVFDVYSAKHFAKGSVLTIDVKIFMVSYIQILVVYYLKKSLYSEKNSESSIIFLFNCKRYSSSTRDKFVITGTSRNSHHQTNQFLVIIFQYKCLIRNIW